MGGDGVGWEDRGRLVGMDGGRAVGREEWRE